MPWVSLADSDAQEKSAGLKDLQHLKALWPTIKSEKKRLLTAILLLPVVSLSQVAKPLLLQFTIDHPVAKGDMGLFMTCCAVFMGLVGLHYTTRFLHLSLTQIAGQQIIHDLRVQLYQHLLRCTPTFFHKHPVGKLVTRVTNDIENINEVFSSGCIGIVADAAAISCILIAMCWVNPMLTVAAVSLFPALFFIVEWMRKKSRTAYNELRLHLADLNIQLQDTLGGIEIVQNYQLQSNRAKDYRKANQAYNLSNLKTVVYDSSLTAVIEVFSYLSMLAVIGYFLWQQTSATPITFGTLMAFLIYVQMLYEPLELLTDKFTFIQSGLASVEKIMELMDEPTPEVISQDASFAQHYLPEASVAVAFDNVEFTYPNGHQVLKGISFTINPGEKVAVIGRTGAGKSTLIKLLLRQYHPQQGQIVLNNVPITQWPDEALHEAVALIPQEDVLFARNVVQNITLEGDDEILDRERWHQVMVQTQLDHILPKLVQQEKTVLVERGKSLSAGERQLVCFARALWHNPGLLILDEATSAIDPGTEALMKQAMDKMLENRSALIVAHRLSTVEQVDKVVWLEHGRVKAVGPPSEVLKAFRQTGNVAVCPS